MTLRRRIVTAIALLLTAGAGAATLTISAHSAPAAVATCTTSTPFAAGVGGYAVYRIPSVVQVDGVVVAMAEARRSTADAGDVEIVQRRSLDGGCTWGAQTRIADAGTDVIGNPVPTVTATGAIVLVMTGQAGDVTQTQIQAGTVSAADGRRVYVQTSTDAGGTWSPRREITSTTKRSAWLWYATGPGHGIALRSGHPGRLIVAANHTMAGSSRGAHLLISDDDGVTWRLGAVDDHTDGTINPDESSVAERIDGALYISSRDQYGTDPANRLFTFSLNSGNGFSLPLRPATTITAPVVEGSVLQDPGLPDGVSCAPLLLSLPDDPAARQHLVLRRSSDGGWTWTTAAVLAAGPSAYSDMVKTDRTTLGVLYEVGDAGPYERIEWQRVPLTCP
jgi:sialidase-1